MGSEFRDSVSDWAVLNLTKLIKNNFSIHRRMRRTGPLRKFHFQPKFRFPTCPVDSLQTGVVSPHFSVFSPRNFHRLIISVFRSLFSTGSVLSGLKNFSFDFCGGLQVFHACFLEHFVWPQALKGNYF